MSTSTDSDTYIVHMDLTAMPKAFSSHHSWYLTTLSSVSDNTKATTSSNLVYAYTNAINGFSAVLSSNELDAIKNSPGYVSSIRDTTVKVDTTQSYRFLGLNSDNGAWPASDYGKDVIVGVVDTGVWPESRSFNDDGMTEIPARWRGECESGTKFNSSLCNKKLIGARYFNKGLLAKNPNLTISMNSARDTDGHGTHTSSTAAGSYVEGASFFGYASGTARGMAPNARVSMYKALWDEGAYLSDVLAAIDQAILDGVDVISLSLGIDGLALYADPVAVAAFAAMEKGIFVSTSSGNEGPYLETLHNGTPWVLNVAAGTIDREFQGTISLGNGASATDTNDTLSEQLYNVRNANVLGGVFISNNTDLTFYIQTPFPAVFFTLEEGQKIQDYIKSDSKPKASFKFQETGLGTKPAPKLASYSSRGPSQSCPFVLKPDITAPGDLILASWPSNSPVTDVSSGQLYNNFNLVSVDAGVQQPSDQP
ncbi:UNVERIFIED_CONTAM: Subtilisin-like protease SBT3 [Sesamum radiatum]|uniref:Subtilisin-like protease SBT3 n=1 Tax=Sesamum radiatum TaxID=300843 RepID=A0AAW2PZG5_SESRA